jgi:hypothetical protein
MARVARSCRTTADYFRAFDSVMTNLSKSEVSESASGLAQFPFLSLLRSRRSRRFGLGMKMPGGPLAYQSRHQPAPLTEDEEAALVFAACGVTGHSLADLCYNRDGGGNIMAGLVARTIASGDGLQTVALIVTNDQDTHLIRRPRELPSAEIPELIELGRQGAFTELYRRLRVKIKDGRAAPPTVPLFNINANSWSAHAPGTSYFLPVNDLTFMYLNGLLEILNEQTNAFILDERNHFRSAGLARFARNRGGHLEDDPREGRVVTIRQVEQFVSEFVTVEQGMMLQNLGLMAEALGLGGFPNFANHEYGWFQALGFRMKEMPASRYVGAGWLPTLAMRVLKRDPIIPYPIGLERNDEVLLKPFCPPYFKSMTEAVKAVVEIKFGAGGVFGSGDSVSAWANHSEVAGRIPRPSDATVAAAAAYCEYIWSRYGRFPAHLPPYRTVLGFQACHLDADFYSKFYKPEVLTESQRQDFQKRTGL